MNLGFEFEDLDKEEKITDLPETTTEEKQDSTINHHGGQTLILASIARLA